MAGPFLEALAIVLQARMGSSRLPGKIVRSLAGRPMIEWIMDRLQRCQTVKQLIVATSDSEAEIPLIDLARQRKWLIFRGSEVDVLDRYFQCAQKFNLAHVIRATADNPFVDPEECDRLVELYASSQAGYACSFPEFGSGFPKGVGLEIISFGALKQSWSDGRCPNHREHVNEFIHENPQLFRMAVLRAPLKKQAPELSLTVDTVEDFKKAERLYSEFLRGEKEGFVPVEWVVNRLKK